MTQIRQEAVKLMGVRILVDTNIILDCVTSTLLH
jgi:hypothetical protein